MTTDPSTLAAADPGPPTAAAARRTANPATSRGAGAFLALAKASQETTGPAAEPTAGPERQQLFPHPFYENEFVDAAGDLVPGAVAPAQAAPVAAADSEHLVPHPFYEGEFYDPAAQGNPFGADGFSFGDLLDIINPLQHIPVLSSIYRALTGDTIAPAAQLAGGALFGGPVGLFLAFANGVVEESSGRDIAGNVLALAAGLGGGGAETAVAQIEPAAGAATAPATPPKAAAAMHTASHPPAPVKAAAALTAQDALGLPFGGLSATPMPPAMPAAAVAGRIAAPPETTDDPVRALLQARAAVPRAGAVKALGPSSRGRVTLPHTAIPAKIAAARSLAGSTGNAATGPAAAPRPVRAHRPPGLLSPDTARLVPELSPTAKRDAPKAETAPAAPTPKTAAPLPPAAVPQAMMQALEKYEATLRMRRQRDATTL